MGTAWDRSCAPPARTGRTGSCPIRPRRGRRTAVGSSHGPDRRRRPRRGRGVRPPPRPPDRPSPVRPPLPWRAGRRRGGRAPAVRQPRRRVRQRARARPARRGEPARAGRGRLPHPRCDRRRRRVRRPDGRRRLRLAGGVLGARRRRAVGAADGDRRPPCAVVAARGGIARRARADGHHRGSAGGPREHASVVGVERRASAGTASTRSSPGRWRSSRTRRSPSSTTST